MAASTRPFEAAEYLDSAADPTDLLSDAVDSGDPRLPAEPEGAITAWIERQGGSPCFAGQNMFF